MALRFVNDRRFVLGQCGAKAGLTSGLLAVQSAAFARNLNR